MQIFSCRDVSQEFEAQNYFGSRTSMSYVSDSVVLELSWSLRMAACMGSHGWIAEVGLRDFLRV